MQESIIPIKSEYESLLEEIRQLQGQIAELTALRDDLVYHICPALQAEYEEKIASLERELLAAQMYLREKQRIIELLQAQINLQKTVSFEKAQKAAREDFREYEDRIRQEAKNARKSRERWKKESQWSAHEEAERKAKEKTNVKADAGKEEKPQDDEFDGDDKRRTQKTKEASETTIQKLKRLYRQIVKRLHPDAHPDATEHERELFLKASRAYEKGDLQTLEQIWDELSGMDVPGELFEENEEGICKLRELLEKLKVRLRGLSEEIRGIKTAFPYTVKPLLDDPSAVAAKRKDLQDGIDQVRQMDQKLEAYIEKLKAQLKEGNTR